MSPSAIASYAMNPLNISALKSPDKTTVSNNLIAASPTEGTDKQPTRNKIPVAEQGQSTNAEKEDTNNKATNKDTVNLSKEDLTLIRELAARDREVRAHEAAHAAVAAQYAGRTSFTYDRGPDGRSYAVGGEVSLNTSTVAGDPEATLKKAETIRAAAVAPLHPSSTDRNVAASASRMAAQARSEILTENKTETATTLNTKKAPAEDEPAAVPSPRATTLASDPPTPVERALDTYG